VRPLALAATAQLVNGAVIVLLSTIGGQDFTMRNDNPSWWIG
jgi:hypothetical protein